MTSVDEAVSCKGRAPIKDNPALDTQHCTSTRTESLEADREYLTITVGFSQLDPERERSRRTAISAADRIRDREDNEAARAP